TAVEPRGPDQLVLTGPHVVGELDVRGGGSHGERTLAAPCEVASEDDEVCRVRCGAEVCGPHRTRRRVSSRRGAGRDNPPPGRARPAPATSSRGRGWSRRGPPGCRS